MKPYSIVCTTCQSRLRVRKASAIGEILACPKCGSMVLITPPPDTADSRSDSGSGSAAEIGSPPAAAEPQKSERKQRFRGDFPPPPTVAQNGPPHAPTGPMLPDNQWASPTAQRVRKWGLLAAAALLGIILAIAVVSLIAKSMSPHSKPSTMGNSKVSSNNAQPADTQPEISPTDAEPDSTTTDHATANEPKSPPDGQPPSPALPSPEPPNDSQPMAPEPDAPAPASEPVGETRPSDAPPAPPKTPAGQASPAPEPATPPTIPDSKMPPKPASPVTTPSPPSEDVKARLAVVLISIEFESVPLSNFADFVSNMTGIPITLDLDAIQAAGLDTETKLTIDARGVTVQQAVQAALKAHELAMRLDGDQIVFTTQDAVDPKVTQRQYTVLDLAPDPTKLQALAVQITRFVAPTRWQDAGGQGRITTNETGFVIDQDASTHFQVARFLDRLRVTRGLLPRTEVPKELIDIKPAFQQAAKDLARPITVTFGGTVHVSHALQFLQAKIDANLLVNWCAVAPTGWLPSTKTHLEGRKMPLEQLLQQWLRPQKLGYRLFDKETIQITTEAWLDAHPETEFYVLKTPPKNEAEIESLLTNLRDHVGTARFAQAGGLGQVAYDTDGRCLIVSLPQPAQRIVARWLADRNGKSAP